MMPTGASKHGGSGRKGRGESRSQGRRAAGASEVSGTRKDASLTRKQQRQPAVPSKTREEIEAETRDLNTDAKSVH